jgi:hypothetical protein
MVLNPSVIQHRSLINRYVSYNSTKAKNKQQHNQE